MVFLTPKRLGREIEREPDPKHQDPTVLKVLKQQERKQTTPTKIKLQSAQEVEKLGQSGAQQSKRALEVVEDLPTTQQRTAKAT